MAGRYFVMGQVFVADGTTTTDSVGRHVTDKTITVTGGAGNFTIYMTQGITSTVTSGTAAITGSPVTLSAGANTLTAGGDGTCTLDITIGTAANWNSVQSWAATSGGTGGAVVPTSSDDVFFDANSFTAAGQTVTVDAAANCLSMDWTGATNTPNITVAAGIVLNVYGSATFIAAMSTTAGDVNSYFNYKGTGKTITTNGLVSTINHVFGYSSGTGSYTLLDNVTVDRLELYSGTLDTNGKTITASDRILLSGAAAKTLTIGTSIINCLAWTYSGSNLTLTDNTATINVSGNFTSTAGIATYNIVNLTGPTSTITGSNTFNTLGLTRAGVQTITFTDGTTQTLTKLLRDAGVSVKTLAGSGVAGWNIASTGSIQSLDYISVSHSTAAPVGKFFAGNHSTDGGDNVGWYFTTPISFTGGSLISLGLGIKTLSMITGSVFKRV